MRNTLLLLSLVAVGCSPPPSNSDGGGGVGGGAGGSAGGACANVGCSGQGQCVVQNGAATCQCNAGYAASGLTCVQMAQCEGKANGTACSDGNLCTTGDSCMNNQCVAGAGCGTPAECATMTCDMAVGCVSGAVADGTACSIGVCVDAGCLDNDIARWPIRDRSALDYDVNGGVTFDKVTGLLWQRDFDLQYRTLAEAKAACASLALADGGWRLPSRIELLSVVDYNRLKPALNASNFPIPSGPSTCQSTPDCNTGLDTTKGSYFGCENSTCILLGGNFWSATATDAGSYAVNFTRGEVQTMEATGFARTRCVKFGTPPVVKPSRFTLLTPDVIKDEYTGLSWETQPKPVDMRGDVLLACEQNVGYRLPKIGELHTLVMTRERPYQIDSRLVVNALTGPRHWADPVGGNTPAPGGNNWAVQFDTGTGGFLGPTFQSSGRCVKSP